MKSIPGYIVHSRSCVPWPFVTNVQWRIRTSDTTPWDLEQIKCCKHAKNARRIYRICYHVMDIKLTIFKLTRLVDSEVKHGHCPPRKDSLTLFAKRTMIVEQCRKLPSECVKCETCCTYLCPQDECAHKRPLGSDSSS